MDTPKTGGEFLEMLRALYETGEMNEIARRSGISRTTLDGWAAKPGGPIRAQARGHFRRIFSAPPTEQERVGAPLAAAAPDIASIAAALARIERRLDDLLKIRDPKRINQMIDAKAREKIARGGSA